MASYLIVVDNNYIYLRWLNLINIIVADHINLNTLVYLIHGIILNNFYYFL
jgi:hypothetical protein